ncbi:MAG: sulfurase [Sulfitobacter sp.]
MPALLPTEFQGRVTWLGVVADSKSTLRSEALDSAELRFAGIDGECHGGLTRPSCVRTKAQYSTGTEIRNVRQLSVLSAEDLAGIAANMGLDQINPAWLGVSMVIAGIPDFTHVPPSSRLQMPSGASITVDMENRPCVLPGREIEKDAAGFGAKFKAAAKDRRGVTAWVEREGKVSLGDVVTLHIPDQPVWRHLDQVRS